MIVYTTASTGKDLEQIIELQEDNLPQNLTPEQRSREGFVTVIHSYGILQKMNDREQAIIAKDDSNVIGYLLAMTREIKDDIPVLIPMFEAFDQVIYDNQKISAYEYIVVGQVCIAAGYRGKGILDECYIAYKNHLSKKYDFAVTEILANNLRSINAHRRIGFKTVHSYKGTNGEDWEIVLWDWRK